MTIPHELSNAPAIYKLGENHSATRSELIEYFSFLDGLRCRGETNMWGASLYVVEEFGVSRKAASDICNAWMISFDHNVGPEERVDALIPKLEIA